MDIDNFAALFGTTQCLIGLGCSALNIIVIVVCAVVAAQKNRSAFGWGVLGFFFSVFALFILLLLPTVQPPWPVVVVPPPMVYPPAPAPYVPPPPPPAPYAPQPAPYVAPPPANPYPVAPAATMIQAGWRLTVVHGLDAGQSFALGAQARLGRSPDNDIRLNDPQASRYHAFIQYQQGNYVLADQGSGNGTYVNGKLINRPTPLAKGDVIAIGNTQIQVG